MSDRDALADCICSWNHFSNACLAKIHDDLLRSETDAGAVTAVFQVSETISADFVQLTHNMYSSFLHNLPSSPAKAKSQTTHVAQFCIQPCCCYFSAFPNANAMHALQSSTAIAGLTPARQKGLLPLHRRLFGLAATFVPLSLSPACPRTATACS